MLFFSQRFTLLANGVSFVSDVQLGSLTTTGFMRKYLSPFEFFLEAILVEAL